MPTEKQRLARKSIKVKYKIPWTWCDSLVSMTDPNQPFIQIFKIPRNKQRLQNNMNMKCPNFLFSLSLKSKSRETNPVLNNVLGVRPPWFLCGATFRSKAESEPSTRTVLLKGASDLGEFTGRSISWWLLSPLLLMMFKLLVVLWVSLLLLRLNECARRVIGPENRGLLTRWETPSLPLWCRCWTMILA